MASFILTRGADERLFAAVCFTTTLLAAGCATLPPGLDAPKTASTALANPETTAIGRRLWARAGERPGLSGFNLLVDGSRSFAMRVQIAERAERTLDLQYFVFQQDDTGQLLLEALLAAADRGVRVRLLLDDAFGFDNDSKIRPLAAHGNIEIRIYNPFVMRQQLAFLRGVEYLLAAGRVNYRMHNKLFIGDNAIAVAGGRNIGDEYFQASSDLEFGDFDLVVAGPIVRDLSHSFDVYWNDRLAVPVEALPLGKPSDHDLAVGRGILAAHSQNLATSGYVRALPRTDMLSELLSGKLPLTWAKATLAYDTPDKASTVNGEQPGHLMWTRVAAMAAAAKTELVVVSPYLVPGASELDLIHRLRGRGVRVRMLTNSLASTDMPIVHAGYQRYRVPLLDDGVELYEVRPRQGSPQTGRSVAVPGSSGQFALHAKLLVVDRQRVFVGSMNFDRRSLRINTEIGLIIDSPQLARDVARRFEVITQPSNSYQLMLEATGTADPGPLRWLSTDQGRAVQYDSEPGVDAVKRSFIDMLSLLPLDELV